MKKLLSAVCLGVLLYTGYNVVFAQETVYVERKVTVYTNDTLWDIAAEYRRGDEDIRAVVDRIYDANGLSNCMLQPGQVLVVPVRADGEAINVASK